ncbi:aminoglycoside 6-adenylyltransferase [Alkalihalobacillus pseudalcaliphilus]|uniref:aminoglycoside 6-adenylyltransferase n=1 Tax=Alkalihalobacillus pseudalcaliphilus TaxID=79884 RepID=UPI00064E0EFA|nr:aminoglycoside 6-adenylyltransferase [Alkalihalobacillus pseudalcaliphilus]KMK75503.1 aminoglycoside adenylyltransferase [Alkalihalobacillus pseudalcaliphilus]
MRTAKEIYERVLKVAKADDRIRLVGLNGSRTNQNVPEDWLQDYDVVYVVTDIDAFVQDPNWIDVFGKRTILQMPENMAMFPPELGNRFSYLMLFDDYTRIDLILVPYEEKENYLVENGLTKVLLNKDEPDRLYPTSTDKAYWIQQPSEEFYHDCCNEFWWVTTYVAKGLARREILYAQDHLNQIVRPMLLKMLSWRVGIETDFSLSVGKNYKYIEQYLDEDIWQQLLLTFARGSYEDMWHALFTACDLFHRTAKFVEEQLSFTYKSEEEDNVRGFLQFVYSEGEIKYQ